MSARNLTILAACIIGVFAYIYFGIQLPSEREADREDAEKKFFQGSLASSEKIEILRGSQPLVTLGLERGFWYVQKPFQDFAKVSQVQTLVGSIESAKIERVLYDEKAFEKEKPDLKSFGLEERATELRFFLKNQSEPIVIKVGIRNPNGKFFYAMRKPNEITLIRAELDFVRSNGATEYREKKIVNVETTGYRELIIDQKIKDLKHESIHLQINKENQWSMLKPYPIPLDQDYVSRKLGKLPIMRVSEFLEKAPKALDQPEISLRLGFREGVRDPRSDKTDKLPEGIKVTMARSLKDGKTGKNPDDYRYFIDSDKTQAGVMARFHFDNFSSSWKDYARKSFDVFTTADVQKLSYRSQESASYEIQKKEGQFQLLKEDGSLSPLNQSAVETALNHLRDLRADELLRVSERSIKKTPKVSVRLELSGGRQLSWAFFDPDKKEALEFSDSQQDSKLFLTYELRAKGFLPENFELQSLESPEDSES